MYLSLSVKWFSLFISVSLATRCEDIGYKGQYFMDPGHIHDDTRNAGQRAPVYPNPFDQGMGWNVVEAKDCWVRFQTAPKDTPESLRTAKVDTLLWDATEDQVTTTMENYNWSPGNIMLWHKLNVFALRNANIIAKTDVPYDAQPRLNLREMVVSIMLPSGIAKLKTVSNNPNKPSVNSGRVAAWGAEGTVSPSDYAYTSPFFIQWALRAIIDGNLDMAWVAAENPDEETCVIIDFRGFPSFPASN